MSSSSSPRMSVSILNTEYRVNQVNPSEPPFVVYVLHVTYNECSWRIERRFSEFATLNEWVQQQQQQQQQQHASTTASDSAAASAAFPSKLALKVDDELLQRRTRGLNQWMGRVLESPKLAQSATIKNWLHVLPRPRVIYQTQSVCSSCVLIDGKPMHFIPSEVVARDHRVYLIAQCKDHGPQMTLYCADEYFFERMRSFSLKALVDPLTPPDMEDLASKLDYSSKTANLPLVMEMCLNVSRDNFLSDEQIAGRVDELVSMYPKDRKFCLKLVGKQVTDIPTLNLKVQVARAKLPVYPVLLEVTYERLMKLAKLADSVLLRGNVFPALNYRLQPNETYRCTQELDKLCDTLSNYVGIQVVVNLSFDWPIPDLGPVLKMLMQKPGLVRLITFSLERSPKRLLDDLRHGREPPASPVVSGVFDNPFLAALPTPSSSSAASSSPTSEKSIDSFSILSALQDAGTKLRNDDFFPASVAVALEPFLRMAGYGRYMLRASSLCGYVCCLCPDGNGQLIPLARLFDVAKFFGLIRPLLPLLDSSEEIGWKIGRKLKSAFKKCKRPGVGDVISYLTDESKFSAAKQFIDQLMFIVVENKMDLSAVDLVRRCDCINVKTGSKMTKNGIVSSCVGCL